MSDLAPAPPALAQADPDPVPQRLRECPGCGLFQHIPALPRGTTAQCGRCGTILRRRRTDPVGRAFAFAVTGLVLLVMAVSLPFLDLDLRGRDRATTLLSGPAELQAQGMWELSVVVLITTFAAPLLRLLALIWVLAGLRLDNPPRHLAIVFRWVERLKPWAMVEVFMLGVFVAYTRLVDLAHVQVGAAVYALGGLMLVGAAADAVLDPDIIWTQIERRGLTAAPMPEPPRLTDPALVACDACGHIDAPSPAIAGPECPRCGATLHRRKPHSIARTWALLAAAAVLYLPANLLPVLSVIRFGRGAPDTILGGVGQLVTAGMWPLAVLVFFASITVPVLKLVGLVYLLVTTARRADRHLRRRTAIYRVVDVIGRWSMIDVFMISILTAMVRWGALASVIPQPGVLAFCAVVILTILAARCFDPRLMWDAAERQAADIRDGH